MTFIPNAGVITLPSTHSVEQTVLKIEELLRAKGVKLFGVIDHSGEAQQVGLYLRPTILLIFGNPRAGTPLMVASPTSALDLPLKLLVWENEKGRVQISYNSASSLQARHALPLELIRKITFVESLAADAAE